MRRLALWTSRGFWPAGSLRAAGLLTSALAAAVGVGGCGSGHVAQRRLSASSSVQFERVKGHPFGVVATQDGRYAFVDLIEGRVLVYSTQNVRPHLIRSYPVPGEAVGSSLTRDGRLLLIAHEQGAAVISVARAEQGARNPILGILSPPASAHLQAAGAIETSSSRDGSYVFVSLEYGPTGGAIAVYRIGSTSAPHLGPSDYVGAITLGQAVVGSALSPDGKYLYVTSELAQTGRRSELSRVDGTLSVISVSAAEHDPARSVLATVPALRQPVRVAVSPDGSVVWVTARASNRLLAFSATKLLSDPTHAMLAEIKVGTAPVGVAVDDHGGQVIVADSNRFNARGAHAAITLVDARQALKQQSGAATSLPAGQFPREIAIEPDGVALVSNFASQQLEAIEPVGGG